MNNVSNDKHYKTKDLLTNAKLQDKGRKEIDKILSSRSETIGTEKPTVKDKNVKTKLGRNNLARRFA